MALGEKGAGMHQNQQSSAVVFFSEVVEIKKSNCMFILEVRGMNL